MCECLRRVRSESEEETREEEEKEKKEEKERRLQVKTRTPHLGCGEKYVRRACENRRATVLLGQAAQPPRTAFRPTAATLKARAQREAATPGHGGQHAEDPRTAETATQHDRKPPAPAHPRSPKPSCPRPPRKATPHNDGAVATSFPTRPPFLQTPVAP